jgi:hypothetical protein
MGIEPTPPAWEAGTGDIHIESDAFISRKIRFFPIRGYLMISSFAA